MGNAKLPVSLTISRFSVDLSLWNSYSAHMYVAKKSGNPEIIQEFFFLLNSLFFQNLFYNFLLYPADLSC